MHYSFSTVLMTILASNLIIVLITFCFRHKKVMLSIGYRLLAIFLALTLIRFLFPFELPFTRNVFLPECISVLIAYCRHPFFSLPLRKFSLELSAWTVFEFVWLIGFLVQLIRHIVTYHGCSRFLSRFGQDISMEGGIRAKLDSICGQRQNRFRVVVVPSLQVPQIFGIFSPRILLPSSIDVESEEFLFSLRHEVYHYYHHDLLIKEAVNLLCILYWWNPACVLLKKQVGLILEMHVDDSLVDNNPEITLAYLRSLIRLAEAAAHTDSPIPSGLTVAAVSMNESELEQRFQMMCRQQKSASIPLFLLLLVIVASTYFASYAIILEASSNTMLDDSEVLELPDGFYAVPASDNTYSIYYNGTLIETVPNLDYYRGIPVLSAD